MLKSQTGLLSLSRWGKYPGVSEENIRTINGGRAFFYRNKIEEIKFLTDREGVGRDVVIGVCDPSLWIETDPIRWIANGRARVRTLQRRAFHRLASLQLQPQLGCQNVQKIKHSIVEIMYDTVRKHALKIHYWKQYERKKFCSSLYRNITYDWTLIWYDKLHFECYDQFCRDIGVKFWGNRLSSFKAENFNDKSLRSLSDYHQLFGRLSEIV